MGSEREQSPLGAFLPPGSPCARGKRGRCCGVSLHPSRLQQGRGELPRHRGTGLPRCSGRLGDSRQVLAPGGCQEVSSGVLGLLQAACPRAASPGPPPGTSPGSAGRGRQPLSPRGSPPVPATHPSGTEGRKPDCCLRLCFEHVSGFKSMFNKGYLTSTEHPESLCGCEASTIGVSGARWGQTLLHHPGTTPQSAQVLQRSFPTSSAPLRPQFPGLLPALPAWLGRRRHETQTPQGKSRGWWLWGGRGHGQRDPPWRGRGRWGHREQGKGSRQGMGMGEANPKMLHGAAQETPRWAKGWLPPSPRCLRRVFLAGTCPAAERAAVKG